jgi:transcriptional regulator of acetoin/glycerol metabolism
LAPSSKKPNLRIISADGADILPLHEVERRHIEHALERLNGNLTEASEILGISRATMYRKVVDLGLKAKVLEFRRKK